MNEASAQRMLATFGQAYFADLGRKGGSRPKPRALSLEQRRDLAKRKQEGAHWTELVNEFGVSQSTVYNVLKEMTNQPLSPA